MGKLIEKLRGRFGAKIVDSHERFGDETVVVGRDDALPIFRYLRDDAEMAFDFLMDLTAVDYLGRTPRFEVVTHLFSLKKRHRLRVKIGVDPEDGKEPWVHSLASLWQSANWAEREAFDMYGVRFEGHPDLRRILMYDSFEGYPLRKDYPYQKRQPIVPERDPIEDPWPPRTFGARR